MNKSAVLFVDDEINILQGLKRRLRPLRNQWDLHFANGGAEALEIISSIDIDVVVSDMRMPKIDGAMLLKKISETKPGIIRIVLSGQSHKNKLLQIVNTAHQFLSKPCESEQLISTIQNAIKVQEANYDRVNKNLVSQVESLISQPEVSTKLQNIMDDANSTALDVYEVVRNDVGMAAKIMQLVNSSFFDSSMRVGSLLDACQALGKELLGDLLHESEAFRFAEPNSSAHLAAKAISEQSTEVAERAVRIAKTETDDTEFHNKVFLAGLLHDVGKLIFFGQTPEVQEQILPPLGDCYGKATDVEPVLFGLDHAEAGAVLLSYWAFDSEIIEACAHHHAPRKSDSNKFGILTCVYAASKTIGIERGMAQAKLEKSEYINRIACADRVTHWLDELESKSIAKC